VKNNSVFIFQPNFSNDIFEYFEYSISYVTLLCFLVLLSGVCGSLCLCLHAVGLHYYYGCAAAATAVADTSYDSTIHCSLLACSSIGRCHKDPGDCHRELHSTSSERRRGVVDVATHRR